METMVNLRQVKFLASAFVAAAGVGIAIAHTYGVNTLTLIAGGLSSGGCGLAAFGIERLTRPLEGENAHNGGLKKPAP